MRWLLCLLSMTSGWLPAATVTERTLNLTLTERGFVEHETKVIALLSPADLEAYREYEIQLDEHVKLESSTAVVLNAAGRRIANVGQRSYRREESTGFGLYTSAYTIIVPFPRLEVGQQLLIDIVRRHEPPFLSTRIELQLPITQDSLVVNVRGGRADLRWRLDDPTGSIELQKTPEGLILTGRNVSKRARGYQDNALVQISWDSRTSWPEVGQWYSEIVAQSAGPSDEVRRRAEELCDPTTNRRECLEAVADHVRKDIRYEAVSVGAGGWVPTPSHDVLQRGWGDCKDKSLLLSEMLSEVGIPSWLALIQNGRGRGVNADFASPNGFNHCIVAIDTSTLSVGPSEPVVDGLFLVDPTVAMGHISWLSPTDRGRSALVVSESASRLISIPEAPDHEMRVLDVAGRVSEDGTLQADVTFTVAGLHAVPWLSAVGIGEPAHVDRARRRLIEPRFPGATLSDVTIEVGSGPAPSIIVRGRLKLADAVRGSSGNRWIRPVLLTELPEPRRLEGRRDTTQLRAGTSITHWDLDVPSTWCPVEPRNDSTIKDLGHTSLIVTGGASGGLTIDAVTVLNTSAIGLEELPVVLSLAVAERRSTYRRVRFRCR